MLLSYRYRQVPIDTFAEILECVQYQRAILLRQDSITKGFEESPNQPGCSSSNGAQVQCEGGENEDGVFQSKKDAKV